MTRNELLLIIILMIGGSFLVVTLANWFTGKVTAGLDRDTSDRIYARIYASDWILRCIDGLGILLIICGMLKVLGFLKIQLPGGLLGFHLIAIGISVMSLELGLSQILRYRAFASEEATRPVRKKLLTAALVVLLVELCFAGAVCAFVFKNAVGSSSHSTTSPDSQDSTPDDESGSPPGTSKGPSIDHAWISAQDAAKQLGKDPEYLDLLVRTGEIDAKFARKNGENIFYRKQDIDSLLRQGDLRTKEDLEEVLENNVRNEIADLLAANKNEEALKCVREMTGWSLDRAQKFIEVTPKK